LEEAGLEGLWPWRENRLLLTVKSVSLPSYRNCGQSAPQD
jgi:hypothetical protein